MRTRQGETICLGEWIRPASADFPPAGGVWGGMRAGFRTGVFRKFGGYKIRKYILNKSIVFAIIVLWAKKESSHKIILSKFGYYGNYISKYKTNKNKTGIDARRLGEKSGHQILYPYKN